MKVDLGSLHRFATGSEDWEMVDGAWRAHRLPARMRARYLGQDQDDKFRIRMSCPSCVRLRFVTDTRRLRIGLRYGFQYGATSQGALLVDGREEFPFGPTERADNWQGVAFEQSSARKRLLDLWLPHLYQADVVELEMENGCLIEPVPAPPLRWLAYGDSIMQGMSASLPTRTVVARCALALNAAVHNVALGSAFMDEWLGDVLPDGRYDLVSIAYGANDYCHGVPLARFQNNARRFITALLQKQTDVPIALLTPITWPGLSQPNGAGVTMDQYRQILRPLAAEFSQVRLVPGERMLPDQDVWFEGIHPNDRGYGLYADNLLPHLRAALGGQ